MKALAILMALIMFCAIGGAAYLYTTTNISIENVSVIATAAADQQATFDALCSQIATGNIYGTAFTAEVPGDSADYQFYTYTVHMNNQTFLTADMVEVQITPMTGDVMQIASGTAMALPARTDGSISATILTKKDMHSVREVIVTYYLWGIPFSLKAAAGN